jgi:pyrroloquinoline quinone biosynthesis protein B
VALIVKVLGSAAGGGFPQWNCAASPSGMAWRRRDEILWRTQCSLAVSADGARWAIINASPDIRQQIQVMPELHPVLDGAIRNSPIEAVVLTGAEADQVTGLLSLRERQPFSLYATGSVLTVLDANSIFDVVSKDVVPRIRLPLQRPTPIGAGGIAVEAFSVAGKVPLYLETSKAATSGVSGPEDTIGLRITAPGSGSLIFLPGCAAITDELIARVQGTDLMLFDGTFYSDEELIVQGAGLKTSRRMGHVPITGAGGSLDAFGSAGIGTKVYIHINTTNPILDPATEAAAEVILAGWAIAFDGMTFTL